MLAGVADSPSYSFVHSDIRDRVTPDRVLVETCPDPVMRLAAECHVDR